MSNFDFFSLTRYCSRHLKSTISIVNSMTVYILTVLQLFGTTRKVRVYCMNSTIEKNAEPTHLVLGEVNVSNTALTLGSP